MRWSRVRALMMAIGALVLVAAQFPSVHPVSLRIPQGWPKPTYALSANPLSQEGIALGRKLFYDPILSADSVISCSNCHLSYTAFTHVDHAFSHGIYDSIGTRNSPALMNLAWNKAFMWDGAVNHLDMQALAPINHPAELGESTAHVVSKLQRSRVYPALFGMAFGDSIITGEHLLKAIAQFELTLISANSKYDRVTRHEGGEVFTAPGAERPPDLQGALRDLSSGTAVHHRGIRLQRPGDGLRAARTGAHAVRP